MSASAEDILAASEAGARGGNVVFCVGSVLRGDDAAGHLRRLAPQRLLLVDAAAMGLEPGAVRRLRAEDVAVQSLITTHTLPITYLLGELEQMCGEVTFLGIQPGGTEFFDPVHPRVLAAVESVYAALAEGGNFEQYPFVTL